MFSWENDAKPLTAAMHTERGFKYCLICDRKKLVSHYNALWSPTEDFLKIYAFQSHVL